MPRLARVTYVERQPTGWTGPSGWFRGASMAGRYAAGVSVRGQWLSSSLSHLHDDERSSAPLNERELTAMNRTRLFGATGTALMAIGALGAGARPVIQDPIFGVRLLNLPSRIQTVSLTMTTTGAVMMTLAWLMLGRFAIGSLRNKGPDGRPDGPRGPVRRMSRGQLDRTLLLWLLPLLVAPPMYSKDVYSYLAQSQIARLGKDPYTEGPAAALGLDHVFTLSVPSLWRETPAPYGPLFLWIGKGISWLTGDDIVAGALCHRLVELLGVLLIIWATPRLAQRCGVAEVSALWLGAANPLLLMHLIAGIHNEALMLGLMLAGTELAMRGVDSTHSLTGVRHWPRSRAQWASWAPLGNLLAGTLLITASSQVKLPSLLALGFVGMALARRWGGGVRGLFQAGTLLGAVTGACTVLIGWASGLGFGWIYTLGTANAVRSWMSPPTLVALGTGQVGILLGLGDHTTAILSLTRGIGIGIIAIAVSWLLFAVLRGRLHPVGGLGVALGITVLLFPVVQPWYLLWAIIPLAAWATRPAFRGTAIGITLLVGIFGPTANGDRFALFQIIDATAASAIIALLLIAITHDYLPWRRLPNGHEEAPLTLTDRDATIDQDSTTGADAVGDQAIRDGRGSDHSVGQPGP
ncbi:conserved integral membrane protein [Mycobacteroides abscessus subsp. massiliense]|uniref:Mannosyltransferase MptB n=1 Tax=Mycobacteroides abscessus subsp. massiliense TaxID=1962118 RepID=A0A1U4S7N7_9MYCO|nr:alpha-(1-6)-mannopyranosyltransferase [Mycobacteroides abscessus]SIN18326.1 mannosyltransferase MptB [Mycobacteroides abscessus subsp. bolletii]SKD46656.1 conserved integral membrane protein [Mycobacteroides abscessus subsp. massiliense]MBE5500155.1 alpha-(1-6)-mannopyranosyltransferase [Mycobacteroides abscessus]MBE5503266.1 alpha-(1-6)-mannopyranosyltransferase [Mycobacteroides abscessus]